MKDLVVLRSGRSSGTPATRWEIDWEQRPDGHPTKAEVAEALAAHR